MKFVFPGDFGSQLRVHVEDYAAEKRHSDSIDQALGLEILKIERQVKARAALEASASDAQLWEHLSPSVFQTPYSEIFRILGEMAPVPGARVVDLGAGYGRMAFVLEAFFPGVEFLGYELSGDRVAEARRVFALHGLERSAIEEVNLESLDFRPANAGFYFLYDFGTRAAIDKCLGDLRRISCEQPLVVAARGRSSRDAIERGQPWLSQVHSPRHFPHFSIYRS